MSELDKVKEKVKKLIALSQRGEGGEAVNADKLVGDLCKKYNIDINSLLDEEVRKRYFNVGRSNEVKRIFFGCCFKVMNVRELSYTESGSRIAVSLPTSKFLELSAFWEWHKSNFKEEMKRIRKAVMNAYIYKHQLSNDLPGQDGPKKNVSEKDLKELKNILRLSTVLEDKRYQKMLE